MTVAGAAELNPELLVPLDPEPELDVPDDPDPELVLPDDPEPELVLPDDPEPEPLVPEALVVAVELGLVELLVDVPVVRVPVVVVATALLRDRAGSCPDASWMTITDQAATKTVATIATARRRISDARRLRARSRSATTRLPSCAPARRVVRLGEGESGEESGVVMRYLSRAEGIWCPNTVAALCRSRVRGA